MVSTRRMANNGREETRKRLFDTVSCLENFSASTCQASNDHRLSPSPFLSLFLSVLSLFFSLLPFVFSYNKTIAKHEGVCSTVVVYRISIPLVDCVYARPLQLYRGSNFSRTSRYLLSSDSVTPSSTSLSLSLPPCLLRSPSRTLFPFLPPFSRFSRP